MISKNKIKFLKCLKLKKYRLKHQKAIIEGKRLIEEALNSFEDIVEIWFTEDTLSHHINKSIIEKIKSHKIIYDIISKNDLLMLSNTENPQGIIAEVDIKKFTNIKLDDVKNNNLVILDGLSIPGNLGTILRTSAWYNIKSIILTSDSVDSFNPKCLRSGMGAHFYFDHIIHVDRKDIIKYLEDNHYDVYCADLKGKDISKINLRNKWALIFGSEAHGLNKDFNIFNKITIKKYGKIESLNTSVACGIILDKLIGKNN